MRAAGVMAREGGWAGAYGAIVHRGCSSGGGGPLFYCCSCTKGPAADDEGKERGDWDGKRERAFGAMKTTTCLGCRGASHYTGCVRGEATVGGLLRRKQAETCCGEKRKGGEQAAAAWCCRQRPACMVLRLGVEPRTACVREGGMDRGGGVEHINKPTSEETDCGGKGGRD